MDLNHLRPSVGRVRVGLDTCLTLQSQKVVDSFGSTYSLGAIGTVRERWTGGSVFHRPTLAQPPPIV